MKTKLEQLTKAIQLAVPDIVQEFEEQEKVDLSVGKFSGEGVRSTGRINKYERDITLEDCLIAIPGENSEIRKNKYKCEGCGYIGTDDGTLLEKSDGNGKYFVIEGAHISGFYHKCPKCKYGQGDILTRYWDSEVIQIVKLWKFNIPLHQQEQETIDLLHDLICS